MLGFDDYAGTPRIRAEPHFLGAAAPPPRIPVVAAVSQLRGRCTNDLFCEAAISKAEVLVPQGRPFACPDCWKPLSAKPGTARDRAAQSRNAHLPLLADRPVLKARCTNKRSCLVARQEHDIYVRLGNVFVCPGCSKPLSTGMRNSSAAAGRSRAGVAATALLCLVVSAAMVGMPAHFGLRPTVQVAGHETVSLPASASSGFTIEPASAAAMPLALDPAPLPIPGPRKSRAPRGAARHSAAIAA